MTTTEPNAESVREYRDLSMAVGSAMEAAGAGTIDPGEFIGTLRALGYSIVRAAPIDG